MRHAMSFIPALLLAAPLLSGCAAQIVVSEYDFRPVPRDFNAMVADLNSGARELNRFADVDCRFETDLTANAPTAQHIDLDINGTLGQMGSNASLLAFNGVATPCVPSLPGVAGSVIETITLATDQPLTLGQPVTILSGTITMVGGAVFVSDGLYGRLTVTALNAAEGTATGIFELVAVNRADPADPRYLIMRGGAFNADM